MISISTRPCTQGTRSFTLNVQLQSGSQRNVIYGPSGAGKSLTLKAIAGLLTPERGHIRINGQTFFDHSASLNLAPQARRVGYLFQDYALFPHLNVRQNIAFGLSHGWLNPRARDRHDKVEYWVRTFGLAAMAHQLPDDLSGRAAAACRPGSDNRCRTAGTVTG